MQFPMFWFRNFFVRDLSLFYKNTKEGEAKAWRLAGKIVSIGLTIFIAGGSRCRHFCTAALFIYCTRL